MTIVLWELSQSTGNAPGLYVIPPPIILLGSVPLPFIRTPPVALKKQNIHINVRDHVNICSRYHNHVRRSSKPDGGEAIVMSIPVIASAIPVIVPSAVVTPKTARTCDKQD